MSHQAVIVGTGFGGMGAAIQLKRLGIDDLVMLEREDDLGGTWHVNRYPGLAVDIASVTYSYSFEPNPWWEHWYARGPELKKYAEHVADKYDLRRHMRFNTVVEGARWDDDAQEWEVLVAGGEPVRATYLVTATGFLSQPRLPDIEGVGDFAGTVVHSARWDPDVELAGKRVAIIGTGATAVQLIPELARQADHLTVFQRTPIWVTPKLDRRMPRLVQRAFAKAPFTQRWARKVNTAAARADHGGGGAALPPGQGAQPRRRADREAAPAQAGPGPGAAPQADAGLLVRLQAPDVLQRLLQNVHQTRTSPWRPFRSRRSGQPASSSPTDARSTVDVLVLATGFDMWDANFPAIRIVGRDGKDLGQWWRSTRFQAYQGIAVPGFPNLLSLASPYSYSGLSFFTTIEAPDEAHGPVAGRGTPPGGPHVRGHRPGQRGVPRLGHRAARRLGVHPRLVRHRAQLLLQPARGARAAATDLDHQHAQARRRAFPLEDYEYA